MTTIKQLIVSISLGGKEIKVGELVSDNEKIYFKYDTEFIKTDKQISPFKLPLSNEVLTVETPVFDGLHGVFYDSLPEGWGRLLLDRTLLAKGISLSGITPLDRLAFVGRNGKGALIYQPAIDSKPDLSQQLQLDAIANETQKVIAGTSTDIIEELFRLGGSSGGARPKILVGYHPAKDHLIHGAEQLPAGYEHWIIKFPSATDAKDIAQIEYAYHKMAIAAGITMSTCQLFKGVSGKQYFGTKRFDRNGNERLHLHSAAGLMHDNFRLSSMDYGHLMDAAFQLEKRVDAYEKVLRLAVFNVFAHNRDDHSKNASFLMNATGEWQFAPAYDLTFSFSGHGFHSMTIAGEGKNPRSKHLLELATVFGVENASLIIEQVKEVVNKWSFFAKENRVSKASTRLIRETLSTLKD